jgi:hypothetical protein
MPNDLGWNSGPWKVLSTTGTLGVAKDDLLLLTPTTIEIQRSGESQYESTPWATSCQSMNGGLSGTVDNQTVFIQLSSDGSLIFTFQDTTQQRRIRAATLGTVLGTVAGALAGLIAGSPFLGVVVGLVAALTGSGATAGTIAFGSRLDSGGTIVAADTGGPSRIQHSGSQSASHSLKAVG